MFRTNPVRHSTTLITSFLLTVGNFLLLADDVATISPEEMKKIEAAIPDEATAKPRKPRKLLVFSLVGGNHTATPYGAKALELMGARTAAFEVVHENDPSVFRAENLKPFDAICFNNSNRLKCFNDPVLCRGLLEFVKSGKGFVGVHAAATNFSAKWGSEWPEGAEMLGGIFHGHPWHEKVAIKLADPDDPLNAAFGGEGFEITDEIYQFTGPHSKETLRILLRVDETKTDMDKRNKMDRSNDDFAVSWVRSYGKGRVFYCSLGHELDIFWNPAVLRHYLDGIQFALGDLPVDMTPTTFFPDRQEKQRQPAVDPKTAITNPADAGSDYLVQGEYVGRIEVGERRVDHGVQVVALGDGKFRSVAYVGGLPGAGWDRSDKLYADGVTNGDVTEFVAENGRGRATVNGGVMTVMNSQGKAVGTLSRVVRQSPTLEPNRRQTFDVEFTAAEFRDGKKLKDARMTVYHNGVLIHENVDVPATSAGALIKVEGSEPGPVFVQSHKAPLRFRNIWVVEKK